MKLNELPGVPGSEQEPKRKGRGIGSGNGKTAGRGHKGQHARSGGYHRVGFEGGQMPLQMRLPKRGFHSPFRKFFALVNVGDLEKAFESGAEINLEALRAKGLVNKVLDGVKLLADGDVTKSFKVFVDRASSSAVAKIEGAGGQVTVSSAEA
ncbi:MAG: 50S ribosomal protein L15 [Magnetococcales bacterium]|nr:50S ribosomal protein L15 [Magnetococcales bacterium]